MTLKLGKLPATHDPRDLLMAHYSPPSLTPPLTDKRNLTAFKDWEMLGNDGAGDCFWAGSAHETMLWTKEGGKPARFDDAVVLGDYSAGTGYDPSETDSEGNNPTDRGTDVRKGLSYRRKTGLLDAKHGGRHKIGAFVALEPANVAHIKESIYFFDAAGIGFAFPDYAMDQFNRGKPWTVVAGAPEPTDGHYVSGVAYGPKSVYVVTWGRVQEMSWGFFEKYTDEAWGILSPEFLKGGKSPIGFDLAQLQADLRALT